MVEMPGLRKHDRYKSSSYRSYNFKMPSRYDTCFFPPVRQIFNAALWVAPHDGDYHFYSQKEVAGLLAGLGFEVKETFRVGLWTFLADGRKSEKLRAVAIPGGTV